MFACIRLSVSNQSLCKCVCVPVFVCASVSECVGECVCFPHLRARVCLLCGRERKKTDIDREGECRVGRALVSFASRPPPCVCKA